MVALNDLYGKVDEIPDGQTGTPFRHGGAREYTRNFKVFVRQADMGPMAVCNHPALPVPYAIYVAPKGYEYDPWAVCVEKSASRQGGTGGDWQEWRVSCKFSTDLGKVAIPDNPGWPGDPLKPNETGGSGAPSTQGGAAANPEMEPISLDWDFEIVNVAYPYDINQKAFINSAGQPLTPAPTVEVARPVLVVGRSELDFDIQVATDYSFALNLDTFMGYKPGFVQCMPPKASRQYRGPLQYFRVTYRLRFHEDWGPQSVNGWQPRFLDAGTMRKENVAGRPNFGKPVPIMRGAHAITQPICLDGDGQPADTLAANFAPKYIDRNIYYKLPFKWIVDRGFKRPKKTKTGGKYY